MTKIILALKNLGLTYNLEKRELIIIKNPIINPKLYRLAP
jgi:hypothetical protein